MREEDKKTSQADRDSDNTIESVTICVRYGGKPDAEQLDVEKILKEDCVAVTDHRFEG